MNTDNSKWKIMILDDEKKNVERLTNYFSNLKFNIVSYTNSKDAVEYLKEQKVDLLIVDFILKPLTCFETLNIIKELENKPYILLMIEHDDLTPSLDIIEQFSIQTYWEKSKKIEQLYLLVQSALKTIEQSKIINTITNDLKVSQKKLEKLYLDSMKTLRYTVELNDNYSKGHSARVSELSVLIGKYMNLPEKLINDLKVGGLFHDIGKIGISDNILLKNSKLTDEEFAEIKNHPTIGKNILSNSNIFDDIIPIVLYHHEKYDGTGYPENIKGENIPLLARITAVADTFDAMTSKRPYRDAIPLEDVKNEFKKFSGKQFDPKIADIFINILDNHYDEIKAIQDKY